MNKTEVKEERMLGIVLASFSMKATDIIQTYGVTKSNLYYWRKKFKDEGKIDVVALKKRPPKVKDKFLTPQIILPTPEQESEDNKVLFTDRAFKIRLRAINKMEALIKGADDLDKVTKAFKAIDDSILKFNDDFSITPSRKRGSIFDAAEVIAKNMGEIKAKQLELKKNEERKNHSN